MRHDMVAQRLRFPVAPEEEGVRILFERLQSRPRVVAVQLGAAVAVIMPLPAAHGPDFVRQRRLAVRIGLTAGRTTEVLAPKCSGSDGNAWVTVVVLIDDDGDDEPATRNGPARSAASSHSLKT